MYQSRDLPPGWLVGGMRRLTSATRSLCCTHYTRQPGDENKKGAFWRKATRNIRAPCCFDGVPFAPLPLLSPPSRCTMAHRFELDHNAKSLRRWWPLEQIAQGGTMMASTHERPVSTTDDSAAYADVEKIGAADLKDALAKGS